MTADPVRTVAEIWRSHSPHCGRSPSEPGSARLTGWRWPVARDLRKIGALDDAAVRLGGHERAERRAREALASGEFRTGGNEHGPALAHIAHDVREIDRGQDRLVGVAIEDDQVELRDLGLEQLARREGDQRKLADGRAVLLLRRTQDGEVDEIDIGVGLEDVAPGALARMRLAGDEQHAQLLADALDRDDGLVVVGGEFARDGLRLDLDHVLAAMVDAHGQAQHLAGHGAALQHLHAVAADADADGIGEAGILDAQADRLVLADDAEARRIEERDAPVAFALVAGDQAHARAP